MKTKRIILCGLGNVGRAFLDLAAERVAAVQDKYGLDIVVGGVVDIGGAAALLKDVIHTHMFSI